MVKLTSLFVPLFLVACAHGTTTADDEPVTESPDATPPKKDAGTDAKATPDAGAPQEEAESPSTTCSLTMTTKVAACDTCVLGSCCPEDNACGKNADCKSLVGCYNGCSPTDTACLATCDANFPSGVSPLQAWFSCVQTNCNSDCAR